MNLLKRIFPVGSRSLIFGVHQFIWHPYTVYRAWKFLYGTPSWKEAICIFIHDWGYWNKPNMDGKEGVKHPVIGAKIAGWILGKKYHDLILFHSRHYAKKCGVEPSRLCWPDKLSIIYDPKKFYLIRARLSGEIQEYRNNGSKVFSMDRSNEEWFDWLQEQFLVLTATNITDGRTYHKNFEKV